MDFNNDISFEIGGKLVVLIEHQSTINPNIALRLLIYITRILEKKTKGSTLYSKKRLTIPSPEFFVLYNGTDPFPDIAVVRLSDLFADTQDLGLPEQARPLLEEWNMEDAIAYAREEGRENDKALGMEKGLNQGRAEERRHFFDLLNQGLSAEEIKQRLCSDRE